MAGEGLCSRHGAEGVPQRSRSTPKEPVNHLKKLLLAALVTVSVAATSHPSHVSAQQAKWCSGSSIREATDSVARKAGVKPPAVKINTRLKRPEYSPYVGAISFPWCVTTDKIYHEMGHYVADLAATSKGLSMYDVDRPFKAFPNWMQTSSDQYGHERAAHCVGYVLGSRSAYTRCPYAGAKAAAIELLATARLFAPYGS